MAAAHSFAKFDVKAGADGARIIAGGDGVNETFINNLSIKGAVTGATLVEVGLDFVDDPDTGTLLGGPNHFIKKATIGGTADLDTNFSAGAFPSTVSINKVKVDPLADDRFTLTPL